MENKKRLLIENWDGKPEFDAEDTHKAYTERLEQQIKKVENNPDYPPEKIKKSRARNKQEHETRIKEMEMIDKLNKDLAILVPAHSGQLPWLKPCLESYRKIPEQYFTVLAWDNTFFKVKPGHEMKIFPHTDTMALTDALTLKHRTYSPSVGISHFWNALYGLKIIKGWGFKNVLCINGDCYLEKPEGFSELYAKFQGYDILTNHWWPERGQGWCGTMAVICKVDILEEFYVSYLKTMHRKLGTTEGRLGKFILDKGYKVAPVTNPDCDSKNGMFKMPDTEGDWGRLVGFRHLHAEHKVRKWYRWKPMPKECYDCRDNYIYLGKQFKDTVVKYWETKDENHLKTWWPDV